MQLRLGSTHLLTQLLLCRIKLYLLVVLVLDGHLVDQRVQFFQRQVPATSMTTEIKSPLGASTFTVNRIGIIAARPMTA